MADKQQIFQRLGTATRVLNTEIKKEIARQYAIDTGRMKNVSRIVNMKWDENKEDVTMEIKSTFYYHGHNKDGSKWKEGGVDVRKAKKWKGGKVNRNITQAFLKREKVLDQMYKLFQVIIEYRFQNDIKDVSNAN
jgi:hypothetical protein